MIEFFYENIDYKLTNGRHFDVKIQFVEATPPPCRHGFVCPLLCEGTCEMLMQAGRREALGPAHMHDATITITLEGCMPDTGLLSSQTKSIAPVEEEESSSGANADHQEVAADCTISHVKQCTAGDLSSAARTLSQSLLYTTTITFACKKRLSAAETNFRKKFPFSIYYF